jgi:hypothetical protein
MPFKTDTDITYYLLHEDGKVAEKEFLQYLNNLENTRVTEFGFTLVPMINELIPEHSDANIRHLR